MTHIQPLNNINAMQSYVFFLVFHCKAAEALVSILFSCNNFNSLQHFS